MTMKFIGVYFGMLSGEFCIQASSFPLE